MGKAESKATVYKSEKDDNELWDWMKKHPDWYIMKTKENITKGYYIYHKAACHHVSDETRKEDGTLKWSHVGIPKVCAENLDDIRKWLHDNYPDKKMQACEHCI